VSDKPNKTEENGSGRDPVTGRFLVGNPGSPGRPRGYDVRKLVAERAASGGVAAEQIVLDVIDNLREISNGRDSAAVAAGRELLERLCEKDSERLEIEHSGAIGQQGPPIPPLNDTIDPVTGRPVQGLLSGIRKLGQLAQEFLPEDSGSKEG
jgi:hypothetical protein